MHDQGLAPSSASGPSVLPLLMRSSRQLLPATQARKVLQDKTLDFFLLRVAAAQAAQALLAASLGASMPRGPSEEQASIFHGCSSLVLCHTAEWRVTVLRAMESPNHGQAYLRVLVVWLDMLAAKCSVSSSRSPHVHPSCDSDGCAKRPACPEYRDRSGTLESLHWLACTSGSPQPPRPIKIFFK